MKSRLLAALPFTLMLVACDSERTDDLESVDRVEAVDASPDDAPDDATERHGHPRAGKLAHEVERLCEALACSDEQRAEIEALVASAPHRGRHRGGMDHEARAEANAALAAAFRGDAFGASDLAAYRDATGRGDDGPPDGLADVAVKLHGLLDAEQRKTMGTIIAERGVFFTGGHRGKAGKMHGRHGKHDEAGSDRATRRAEKLCDRLACTDEQREQVATALGRLSKPDDAPARAALGEAFAADAFGRGDVDTFVTARLAARDAHREALEDVALELHGILDAEQRATLAEKLEHGGLAAIAGKRHRKGKGKRGRKGKRRRDRHPSEGAPERGLG